MRQIATIKVSEIAVRYGEQAPVATACCNACRTCVQTNVIGIALAAAAGAGAAMRRRFTRHA